MKAGSLTSTISQAEAKKMGLITTIFTPPKPKPASSKEIKDKAAAVKVPGKENLESENKKVGKTSFKVAGTAAAMIGNKKAGNDEEDPIEASLKERMKAGSLNSVVAGDKKATSKLVASKPATMAAKVKEEKKVEEKKPVVEKKEEKKEEKKVEAKKERKPSGADVPKLNTEPKVMKGRKKTELNRFPLPKNL
jgi:hypothetical protein